MGMVHIKNTSQCFGMFEAKKTTLVKTPNVRVSVSPFHPQPVVLLCGRHRLDDDLSEENDLPTQISNIGMVLSFIWMIN